MNKLGFLLLSVTAAVALAGCQPKGTSGSASGTTASDSTPVAVVDGVPISRDFYDFYVMRASGGHSPSELTADQRENALDSLVRAQIVAEQAEKDGLTRDPDTVNLIALSRLNILEQAVSNQYLKDRKPTEQQLRAEYETEVDNMPRVEYHARHILVATEQFADRIIDQLNHGAKFEDLAKQESMDSSKSNGGDIGWFTTTNMVKPFADAVAALKPGEFTQKPVHTQYGWHVIQLVETRPLSPPTYDSVQQRLVQVLESKEFTTYVDGLEKNAKIQKNKL